MADADPPPRPTVPSRCTDFPRGLTSQTRVLHISPDLAFDRARLFYKVNWMPCSAEADKFPVLQCEVRVGWALIYLINLLVVVDAMIKVFWRVNTIYQFLLHPTLHIRKMKSLDACQQYKYQTVTRVEYEARL